MRLVTPDQIDALRTQLDAQQDLAVGSIDLEFDTFDFARTGAALVDRAVALSAPSGMRLAGLGTAWRATAEGPDRFDRLRRERTELGHASLKSFVGFSFFDDGPRTDAWDGYAAAETFIPRITFEGTRAGTRCTVVVPTPDELEPTLDLLASMSQPRWLAVDDTGDHTIESHPHVSDWASLVARAVDDIASGSMDKVVLARSVVVNSTEPVAILRVFRHLAARYPQCYNFAWKSFDKVFMGASPELLASVRGSTVRSNPLAGSAPRGEGDAEDAGIEAALLASEKDRMEHAFVVDDLASRLGPITSSLVVPGAPVVKKMATVQHLSTPIEGVLEPGVGVLDVVGAVHPTPAVGGVARDDAMRFIRTEEHIDRGWYAGGVGWMNGHGDGGVAIALRCGLIDIDRTMLFAGAGIVADSDPAEELEETRLKLRPLLDILAAS